MANFIGTTGNDVLNGTGGNDTFTGGLGNDALVGGTGSDVAIFSGNQADYRFLLNSIGRITVRDTNIANGNEGTDTFSSIEFARFADGDIKLSFQNNGEFQVNTYTASFQENPAIAALKDGSFVVIWESYQQDPDPSNSASGIYAQRYDANGMALGNEFRVNTHINGDQFKPSITALTDGGFVIAWEGGKGFSRPDIDAQRYDANGLAVGGEFRINSIATDNQTSPSITALINGGFVATWEYFGDIYGRSYDVNGIAQGGEFRINTFITNGQTDPAIVALINGGFVVTWNSSWFQDGSWEGIYAQRYDVNGVKQGGEFQVNTHTTGGQTDPAITALTNGGFVITWSSADQDGNLSGVYGQRYDVNGVRQGNEFKVNNFTPNNQSSSSITALTNGGFVVAWTSEGQDGGSSTGHGVYAQRYNFNGIAQGDEFRVNTYIDSVQSNPSIAALTNGGFVVTWQSEGQDGSRTGVYAQRYDAEGRAIGDFTLTGSTNDDHLNVAASITVPTKLLGMAGNDVLQGGGSNDILDGGLGSDTLIGEKGNDSFILDNAADIVTEKFNEGTDKVGSSVTYALSANVENLILTSALAINGTGNGLANVITGNSAVNQLNGGAGNDTLDGRGGNNVLTGGIGSDIFKFTTMGHTDTITDYNVVSDTIQLENAVFTALTTTGTLAASQFRVGAQALDANDFIIYNNVTGSLRYDADGAGAGAAVQIATVGIGLNLTNADIVVI